MQHPIPYLSLAIWTPIVFGVLILLIGSDARANLSRVLALLGSLAGFAVTIPLYTGFDSGSPAMQFDSSPRR